MLADSKLAVNTRSRLQAQPRHDPARVRGRGRRWKCQPGNGGKRCRQLAELQVVGGEVWAIGRAVGLSFDGRTGPACCWPRRIEQVAQPPAASGET